LLQANSRRGWQAGRALLQAAENGYAAVVEEQIASGTDVNFASKVSLPYITSDIPEFFY
jgi:hypothetical protein